MQLPSAGGVPRKISTVIWTCNDGPFVDATLLAVFQQTESSEVIVVDGGSVDGTADRASLAGVKVLSLPASRHRQLRGGVATAHGEILLFIRAGTELPRDAVERIRKAMLDPHILAGELRFRYRPGATLSAVGRMLGLLGLYRNDNAFFVWHNAYDSVGGFRQSRGLEELDLMMRLRHRGRFIRLPCEAISRPHKGDRRYRRILSQMMYWLGWSPRIVGFRRLGRGARPPQAGTVTVRTVPRLGQNVSRHPTMPR